MRREDGIQGATGAATLSDVRQASSGVTGDPLVVTEPEGNYLVVASAQRHKSDSDPETDTCMIKSVVLVSTYSPPKSSAELPILGTVSLPSVGTISIDSDGYYSTTFAKRTFVTKVGAIING